MMWLRSFWRTHFLETEAGLVVILTVLFGVWVLGYQGMGYINELMQGQRANFYRTIASLAGSLFGFSLTVMSIALNLFSSQNRLALVKTSSHYPKLWKTFIQTTYALGWMTLLTLVCLLGDQDSQPRTWLIIPFAGIFAFSLIRLYRTLWILKKTVNLITKSSNSSDTANRISA